MCLPRYATGLCLLATSEKSEGIIRKCLRRANSNSILTDNYWAVTNGFPRTSGKLDMVDMRQEELSHKNSLRGKVAKEVVDAMSLL